MSGYVYGATKGNTADQTTKNYQAELRRVTSRWRTAERKNEKLVGRLEEQDAEIKKLRAQLDAAKWEAAEAKDAAHPTETVAYEGYLNPGALEQLKGLCQ